MTAHETVINLVDTFAASHLKYLAGDYNESAARKDFIDKFFIALGWDVNHDHQTNPYEQEVKEFWTNKCDMLEKTIDQAVYKLYDLTPDEIKLIENF